MQLKTLICAAVAAGAASFASTASAAVTIDIVQRGGDIVATASGALDLTGLKALGERDQHPWVIGSVGAITLGPDAHGDSYITLTGPASFGPGFLVGASSSSGDTFTLVGGNGAVSVPVGYVSGAPISSSDTFSGHTLADLGLTAGRYAFTAPDDTLTLNIGAVPEPATWAVMLLGVGMVGACLRISRRKDTVCSLAG